MNFEEVLRKSNLKDALIKARSRKYFKRTGSPGNYKYYYTEAEYKQAKGKMITDKSGNNKSSKKEEHYWINPYPYLNDKEELRKILKNNELAEKERLARERPTDAELKKEEEDRIAYLKKMKKKEVLY